MEGGGGWGWEEVARASCLHASFKTGNWGTELTLLSRALAALTEHLYMPSLKLVVHVQVLITDRLYCFGNYATVL